MAGKTAAASNAMTRPDMHTAMYVQPAAACSWEQVHVLVALHVVPVSCVTARQYPRAEQPRC